MSHHVSMPPECGILTPLDDIQRALEQDEDCGCRRERLSTVIKLVALLYHMVLWETMERIKRGWRSVKGATIPSKLAEEEEDSFVFDLVHSMGVANYNCVSKSVRCCC
jgi:hypothetical protein